MPVGSPLLCWVTRERQKMTRTPSSFAVRPRFHCMECMECNKFTLIPAPQCSCRKKFCMCAGNINTLWHVPPHPRFNVDFSNAVRRCKISIIQVLCFGDKFPLPMLSNTRVKTSTIFGCGGFLPSTVRDIVELIELIAPVGSQAARFGHRLNETNFYARYVQHG